jgi:hypothetical protein
MYGFVLSFGIAIGSLFASGTGSDTLDQRAFARAAFERLQHALPDSKFKLIERDDTGPAIERAWPDGNSTIWFLGNAYQQYRSDPGQLDAIVDHQLRSWAETRTAISARASESTDVLKHLLPVIKTRGWLETTSRQLKSIAQPDKVAESEPLHRDLTGDLVLVFAQDDVEGMRFVTRGMLTQLRLHDEAALEQGVLDNLAARLGELKIAGKNGRYRLEFDNFYEASLALLASRWRDRVAIDGDPVIAIPARNTLLVCGSRDRDSIDSLRKYADSISDQAAYGLSKQLYTLRDGKLTLYDAQTK